MISFLSSLTSLIFSVRFYSECWYLTSIDCLSLHLSEYRLAIYSLVLITRSIGSMPDLLQASMDRGLFRIGGFEEDWLKFSIVIKVVGCCYVDRLCVRTDVIYLGCCLKFLFFFNLGVLLKPKEQRKKNNYNVWGGEGESIPSLEEMGGKAGSIMHYVVGWALSSACNMELDLYARISYNSLRNGCKLLPYHSFYCLSFVLAIVFMRYVLMK